MRFALRLACVCALFCAAQPATADNWGHWRGPSATGTASPGAHPPVEWSETDNVAWKVVLPGRGHSSPIVWQQQVFVTSAVPLGDPLELERVLPPGAHDNVPAAQRHAFVALAVDRTSGKTLWQKTLREAIPHDGHHYTGSLASHSPVTDGKRLFVFFGSYGLYALDLQGQEKGKVLWQRDFGPMKSKHGHGEGSSPFLYRNTLIVNWDHEGQSFLVALDADTGKERWRAIRDEVTSWASPIVVEHAGPADSRAQVIVSGTARIRGYDLDSGKVIWECGGLSANIVASPVAANGMVWAASSYDKRALVAIRLAGAQGDITGSDNVAWTRSRGTPYVPSPLLYRESLYFLRHYQGILTRVFAETGEERQGPFRLNGIGNVYSSPVAAADRVYITDRRGLTMVISHEEQPKILSINQLDDVFSASPAIADGDLFLRGDRALYRLHDTSTKALPTTPAPSSPR